MNDNQKQIDAAYAQYRKFQTLPRAGWVEKGSRAKSNHAILVPRVEVVELASDLHQVLFSKAVFLYEIANLRHYLETLAKGAHDAVKCKKCFSVYQSGWLKGKCPYCEASAAAFSMVNKPQGADAEEAK